MLPDLDVLMQYQNLRVIQSFMRDYAVSEAKATELFQDVLRYLWITKKHALDKKQFPENADIQFILVMHEEMRQIDEMWHNFILYTYDYMTFCNTYFGEFLHHQRDMAETMIQTHAGFSDDLTHYLTYVYDQLGESVVKRWFACYVD